MPGFCLILEGGAMRGCFTAGVLDALMQYQAPYADVVVSVSAGTLCAVNYVSGQIGRSIRINTTYGDDPRYLSMVSFVRTGDALGKEFVFDKLQNELDPFDFDTFDNSPSKLYAVSTNIETGKPEYLRINDVRNDVDYVRASASMPLISHIVEAGGMKLLDGGTGDSIPIGWALDHGFEKIVVVLTREREFVMQPEPRLPLIQMRYSQYPAYIQANEQRYRVYNRERRTVFDLEKQGRAFVFAPPVKPDIETLERYPEKMMTLYNQGRNLVRSQRDAWMSYLLGACPRQP